MLKKLFIGLCLTGLTQAASANSVQGYFGFSAGAPNFGVGYEHDYEDGIGIGGFFHYAGEEEDASQNQIITFAANTKVHFRPVSNKIGMYAAPGFGIHMVDGVGGSDDETLIGPSLQLGVLFQVSRNVAVGVENLRIYNWLSDDVAAGSVDYLNATMVFDL